MVWGNNKPSYYVRVRWESGNTTTREFHSRIKAQIAANKVRNYRDVNSVVVTMDDMEARRRLYID